ncbi:tetratricopeptide repeat protein [Desulforapulum autotrophicum]|uniref:tetratricopeptide repeat protein n=1 Tax=Desulforapulum autotrophicum TaxID=2296 RepID=UPI001E513533|nr:tetratricopeptide repeat protein [Desulforapulum autotrophicum]
MEAIEESRHQLDTNLSILVAENMIKEKSENPVREYFFYHDLIRDAAYETILLKHRGNLHRKVGEAIENIFYDQIERFYGLLSYHFAKGSQWNKAQEYLIKAGDQANRIAGDSEALSHYKKAMSAHEKIVGSKLDDFEKAVYHRRLGEIYFRRGEHDKALVSLKHAFKLLGVSYPFGKWETRIAILNQFAKQAIKRFFFIFNKKFTYAKLKPIDQEIIKIFETMAWIDVYINQERLAFDVVSALNHAEQISSLSAAVQGYSGVGFLFDTMGFPFIAQKYHDLAMRLIKTVEEDLITATAYHCLGYHLVFQGKWEDALASYKKSADQFQNIGHLKKWGNAKMMMSVILANQGRFAQSLEICTKIAQLGLESGDHQLRGHALHGAGFNQISKGPLDEAVINLQEAIKLLKSIPDYYALAASYTDLARCYLYDEDFATAYSMLKKTEAMIAQKGIRGFMISLFYNALAETYLTIFEKSIEIRGKVTIGVVKKYILKTIKQAKHFKCGQPKALRLNGAFFWLKGNPKKAHQFWKKGLDLCQELGSRNEEGLIYSDMGKRLNDVQYLQKAQEIFIETGARLDLAHVEKAIENLK